MSEQVTHKRGDVTCPTCRPHYPLSCKCGGLIHSTKGHFVRIECDRCQDPTLQTNVGAKDEHTDPRR
jgi:hypothetical protein